ncbi:MAG: hypothetical protein AAF513_19970, partial [Pseudomonadota bacterium]
MRELEAHLQEKLYAEIKDEFFAEAMVSMFELALQVAPTHPRQSRLAAWNSTVGASTQNLRDLR